jgi:cell surface protein SprA
MFPEGAPGTGLAFRFNAAKLAWYHIDPLFTRNNNLTPSHIRNDVNQRSNHFVREILETEIWPNKESPTGIPAPLAVLNMAFYPNERGPYNYDAAASPSAGAWPRMAPSSPRIHAGVVSCADCKPPTLKQPTSNLSSSG